MRVPGFRKRKSTDSGNNTNNTNTETLLASPLPIDKVALTALVQRFTDAGWSRADAEEEAFDAFLRRAYKGKIRRVGEVFLPPLDEPDAPMALALCVKDGDV